MPAVVRHQRPGFVGAIRAEVAGIFVAVMGPRSLNVRVAPGGTWLTVAGTFADVAVDSANIHTLEAAALVKRDASGVVTSSVPVASGTALAVAPDGSAIWTADINGFLTRRDSAGARLADRATGRNIIRLIHMSATQVAAITNQADLIVYEYTSGLARLDPVSTLHIPAAWGLRSFYKTTAGLFILVGTDRAGRGSVVTVNATGSAILSVDRVWSPNTVNASDGVNVGTEIPSLGVPWLPWAEPIWIIAGSSDVTVVVNSRAGIVWVLDQITGDFLLTELSDYLSTETTADSLILE